ncbi:MBL fold metallo-hydrolase [Heliobacterium undosum]|uniref:MBL fold metallo-hydrolase n=1 Tax=Heliomicrobium undosum TaxID=121734 RepID=A0A845KYG2_9FIRM|nr:MBL fold metallo-hydrolase [Heliomicrobium undosum]MZP28907.1 MBL fold metallo-hydrolase [Heliomicrobium undosum]
MKGTDSTIYRKRIQPLPGDGSVPFLSGWRWIHTPGHTPGHVSLFRDHDRVLIAGDAFTTVKQESALAVLDQEKEVHGPPAYFTTDWTAAKESVRRLEALHPSVVITGHGLPLRGEKLAGELGRLAHDFDHLAVPPEGRYVPEHPQL